jgi:hypothetical protein
MDTAFPCLSPEQFAAELGAAGVAYLQGGVKGLLKSAMP